MLKTWAVRKLAEALADYIEGVTPESVKASLGRDVGELDVCARLAPTPFQKLNMDVLDSELSVRVRIPWRNLDAEPTELSVHRMRLEVRMRPRVPDGPESLKARREQKEAAVRRLEEAAAASRAQDEAAAGPGARAGRIARAGHAALRQLRVTAGRIEGRVHRECPGLEPLCFQVDGARLESVGSDWVSPAAAAQDDLYKVLGISGLSAHIGQNTGGECMIGPLTWDARFLHSPKRGLVHLRLEMPEQAVAAGVRIDPSVASYARGCLLWQLPGGPREVVRLPEDAGRRYAVLFSQRLRGEPLDEEQIQELEDAAPPAWIAGWREWCRAQQQPASKEQPAQKQRRRYKWWWSSAASEDEKEDAAAPASAADKGDGVLVLLDAQDTAGFLPEVAPPTHVRLDMIIPRLEGRCQGLEVDAGGANCSIEVKARASNAWEVSAQDQLWQVSASVALRSVSARYDGSALLSLLEVSAPPATASTSLVSSVATSGGSPTAAAVFAAQADRDEHSSALSVELNAAQREPGHGGTAEGPQDASSGKRRAPWDVALRLRGEPARVHLAPWKIRGSLMTMLELAKAWQEEGRRAGAASQSLRLQRPGATAGHGADEEERGEAATAACGDSPALPPLPEPGEDGDEEEEDAWAAATKLADTESSTIQVDLELEAPIVHLELPHGECSLRAHLGGLRVHTHDGANAATLEKSVESGMQMPQVIPVALATFALACELKETSVALVQGASERWVYGPSTLMVYFKRGAGNKLDVQIGASSLKLDLAPDLALVLGQLPLALDFACSPLTSALPPGATLRASTPSSTPSAGRRKLEQRESAGGGARLPLEFGLAIRSLEVMWRPQAADKACKSSCVIALVDQVVAKAERQPGDSSVEFRSSVTRLALEAGGKEILASAGRLTVDATSESSSLQVTIGAPPVSARWAVQPMAGAIAAMHSFSANLARGAAELEDHLPVNPDGDGLSQRLWNRYVTERAQRIEEKLRLEAARFGLANPTSEGGHGAAGREPTEVHAAAGADRHPSSSSAAAAPSSLATASSAPRAQSRRAMTVNINCAEVSAIVEGESSGAFVKNVHAALVGTRGTVRLLTSNRIEAELTLAGMQLSLGRRRILAPRRPDSRLLRVSLRTEPAPARCAFLDISWAQVALVYRQRDFDGLMATLREAVAAAMAKAGHDEIRIASPTGGGRGSLSSGGASPFANRTISGSTSGGAASPAARRRSDERRGTAGTGFQYKLSIDAPLVFLPAETTMRAQRSADTNPAWRSLVADTSGHSYEPAPEEGFAVIDFGHLDAHGGNEPGLVKLALREARAFSSEGGKGEASWRRVIYPLGLSVEALKADNHFDIKVFSPLDEASAAVPRLSFTRAQATQLADIIFLNISYRAAAQQLSVLDTSLRPNETWFSMDALRSVASSATAGSSFAMSIAWRGPLRADVSFTEDAPLARLELLDGVLTMRSDEKGFITDIRCSGVVTDTRLEARNEHKIALVSAPLSESAGAHSVHIENWIPAGASEDSRLTVKVKGAVLWVFPQLINDFLTWGMSLYQQSAQAKAIPQPASSPHASTRESAAPPAGTRAQYMKFHLVDAAVRVAASWSACEGTEYLELAAGAKVELYSTPGRMGIRDISVVQGRWHRGMLGVTEQPPLWCSNFAGHIKGAFNKGDDAGGGGGERINTLAFDTLEIAPCCVQLSVKDITVIATAVTLLSEFEADSAEPADEIRLRDPLELVLKKRFAFCSTVVLSSVQVQLLDDSAGGARPALEVAFSCPMTNISSVSSRGDIPQVSVILEQAKVAAQSYNERIGKWEPVLAASEWFVKYKASPGVRHAEGSAELMLKHSGPLDVAITVPFVHLASSLAADAAASFADAAAATAEAEKQRRAREFLRSAGSALEDTGDGATSAAAVGSNPSKLLRSQGHRRRMLLGANLSNVSFSVCRRDAGRGGARAELKLRPGSSLMPLDALLAGVDSTQPMPNMLLQLAGSGSDGTTRRYHQEVRLDSENDVVWYTGDQRVGAILVRVLMPRPPQRVLVVSSTALLANRTAIDIDVLFPMAKLPRGAQLPPALPTMAAALLDAPGGPEKSTSGTTGVGEEPEVQVATAMAAPLAPDVGGCLGYTVPAGCVCAAPVAALMEVGIVQMQVRPALSATRGVTYNWGPTARSDNLTRGLNIMCKPGDAGMDRHLPGHGLFLEASGERGEWCRVSMEPPFRLANASPCHVHVALGALQGVTPIGDETDHCDPSAKLEVCDGYGGLWEVPPGGSEDIFPVRLDEDGWFYWYAESGRERCRPRYTRVEMLRVKRTGRRITWTCCRVDASVDRNRKFILAPKEELPVFSVPSRGALFSVALKDAHNDKYTSWSRLMPIAVPPGGAEEVTLRLDLGPTSVALGAVRQEGRRVVFFSRLWFADSTGLGIHLAASLGGPPMPSFSDVGLPAGTVEGEQEVFLALADRPPVEVPIPPLGGSVRLQLSHLHAIVVQAEPLAVRTTFGVFCTLLTAMPALMAFSQVPSCQVGFRQEGCRDSHEVSWLGPGESASMYWLRGDRPKRIEVTVRPLSSSAQRGAGECIFSAPFDVSERGVGAFPVTLMESSTIRRLVCIQVDQSGSMSTITASSEECCHRLSNRHPCLVLDAYFEDEEFIDAPSHFIVPYGERVSIARSCSQWYSSSRLIIILGDTQAKSASRVAIDVQRAGIIQVKDSKAVPALVRVDLSRRVALVTVSPVVVAGPVQEPIWTTKVDVKIRQLSVVVLGERPRTEVFACMLGGVKMVIDQSAKSMRETVLEVSKIQVDMLHPKPEVLLASVGEPVLRLQMKREDLAARDVKLSAVVAKLGDLEVTFYEKVAKEAQRLGKELAPRKLGLELDTALSRAGVPYHITCSSPPEPSRKYVLRNVFLGEAKVTVWCSLSMNTFPDLVGVVMQLSSFSDTLEINGAKVKLPEQLFFQPGQRAFEGSLGSLASEVWTRYKPCVKSSWRSLLNNSNAVLGGLFSRHVWAPRQRTITKPQERRVIGMPKGSKQVRSSLPPSQAGRGAEGSSGRGYGHGRSSAPTGAGYPGSTGSSAMLAPGVLQGLDETIDAFALQGAKAGEASIAAVAQGAAAISEASQQGVAAVTRDVRSGAHRLGEGVERGVERLGEGVDRGVERLGEGAELVGQGILDAGQLGVDAVTGTFAVGRGLAQNIAGGIGGLFGKGGRGRGSRF